MKLLLLNSIVAEGTLCLRDLKWKRNWYSLRLHKCWWVRNWQNCFIFQDASLIKKTVSSKRVEIEKGLLGAKISDRIRSVFLLYWLWISYIFNTLQCSQDWLFGEKTFAAPKYSNFQAIKQKVNEFIANRQYIFQNVILWSQQNTADFFL